MEVMHRQEGDGCACLHAAVHVLWDVAAAESLQAGHEGCEGLQIIAQDKIKHLQQVHKASGFCNKEPRQGRHPLCC